MNSQTFYVAKEGYRGLFLLATLIVFCLISEFNGIAFLLFCFCLFWAFLFRDPNRHSSYLAPNAFLSPVDGEVRDLVFQEDQVIVTIEVGLLDVGILRSPVAIDQYSVSQISGVPLFFSSQKHFLAPQSTIHFESCTMRITQNLFHLSLLDSRNFKQGEKMGFLKAGEVQISIKNLESKIDIGDKLKGGESVIGYLQ